MVDTIDLQPLFELQTKQLAVVELARRRYLYDKINWSGRLNMITGFRGVGKTTIILQYLQKNFTGKRQSLYLSADNVLIQEKGLFQIAWDFEKMGGQWLAIDEVHKFPNWNQELKNIYDSLPGLRVVASGSSSLQVVKGQYDLSRRAVVYPLKGMSFREFLNFELNSEFPLVELKDLLTDHQNLAMKIIKQIKDQKILPLFEKYLKAGYYPYYWDEPEQYLIKLNNAINKVLYEDIPSTQEISRVGIRNLQKMLYLVAHSAPYSPNVSTLASDLQIAKDTVYDYLEYLEQAGLFKFTWQSERPRPRIRKPEKIYLHNSNLYFALAGSRLTPEIQGTVREAFLLSQLPEGINVSNPSTGDFLIDGRYLIEVGGKSKTRKQVKDSTDSYLAVDGIEVGTDHRIPLWLWGWFY